MTIVLSVVGALFISTSTPASANEPQTKAAESAKSEGAKVEHAGKATKSEAAKKLSPLEREDQMHAKTMKKYAAKKEKAQAAGDEKTAASIDKQISKENARHEKRVKQLAEKAEHEAKTQAKKAGGEAKTEAKKASGEAKKASDEAKKAGSTAEKDAEAKVPGKADAPKAPVTPTKPY